MLLNVATKRGRLSVFFLSMCDVLDTRVSCAETTEPIDVACGTILVLAQGTMRRMHAAMWTVATITVELAVKQLA